MKNGSRGFTLVELMITLTIAAILVAVAIPNFRTFLQNNRLAGVSNDFLGALQTARTEAIKRQMAVSVCPSDNPGSVAATCTDKEFTGWIAFVDVDNNCDRTAGAVLPDGTRESDAVNLIRTGGPIESRVKVDSSGNCVSFAPSGFLQTVAGRTTAGFTVIWDDDFTSPKCGAQPGAPADSRARAIEVTNTGRSRVSRLLADVNIALADPDVDCP